MKKRSSEVEKNESRNNETDAQRKRHSIFQRNKKHIQRKMAIHRIEMTDSGQSADAHSDAKALQILFDGTLISLTEQGIEIRENKDLKVTIKAFGQ